MQIRQILVLSALSSASLVALAACGPAEPLETPSPLPATPTNTPIPATPTPTLTPQERSTLRGHVRIWTSWGPDAVRGLNERIQSFQAEHPAVAFSLTFVPAEEMLARVQAALDAGVLPSIYMGPSVWGPPLTEVKALLDVGSLVPPQLQRALNPLAWSQVEYRGQVLGLPVQLHGNVLYRNRQLAAVPSSNLRDLLQTSRRLRGTEAVGAALDLSYLYSTPHAEACGGALLTERAPPAIETSLGLCWLELLQGFSTAGPVVFGTGEDFELFTAGGAAWWVGSTELYSQLADAVGRSNLAVDPWPLYEATGGRMAGYAWTENLYLGPGLRGEQLDAAWAFAASLLTRDSQLLFSQPNHGSHIPVLVSLDPAAPEAAAMLAALGSGTPLPLWPEADEYIGLLERAARAVSVQGADPETAQRRAVEELLGPEEEE